MKSQPVSWLRQESERQYQYLWESSDAIYKLHAATYGVPFPNPDTLTMPLFDVSRNQATPKDQDVFFHERALSKAR
jgi:hypothetical protein